jgi:hypothetical protein
LGLANHILTGLHYRNDGGLDGRWGRVAKIGYCLHQLGVQV